MENASKALLIAGGMLLLILVMSLAAYIFKQLGSQTSGFYRDMSDTEIYEYNQQFFNYEDKELRIQDVITVINLAKDTNKRELVPVTIQVYYPGPDDLIDLDTFDTKRELSNSINDYKKKYKCEVEYAEKSNYVGKIVITKIE